MKARRIPDLAGLLLACLVAADPRAATLTVDQAVDDDPSTDDGACSLREAVIAANTNLPVDTCPAGEAPPSVDEIVFDPALDGTDIALSIPGTLEDEAATGDLDVTEDLLVRGNDGFVFDGTGLVVLDAATVVEAPASDRAFHAIEGELTLRDLLVRGGILTPGFTSGGGIRVLADASLTLEEVGVVNGAATVSGAGIATAGDLTLTRSFVESNTVDGAGTGVQAGGGGIFASGGDLTIDESVIAGNTVQGDSPFATGGGVHFGSPGALTIRDSIVAANLASATGTADAVGGGIFLGSTSTATSILRSDISENTASAGSGAARGGGLDLSGAGAPVELVNTTLAGNSAGSDTGASGAGGIDTGGSPSLLTLRNVSVAGNDATGTGTPTGGVLSSGSVEMADTVLAENTAAGGTPAPDCRGAITSLGYNLLGDNTGCPTFAATTGDQIGDVAGGGSALDARLGPLADNGGGFALDGAHVPVFTRAPAEDSPLVDAGDPTAPGSGGACAAEDQRGRLRPRDGDGDGDAVCDIGAIELPEPGPLAAGAATLLALAGLRARSTTLGRPRRWRGSRHPSAGSAATGAPSRWIATKFRSEAGSTAAPDPTGRTR